MRPFVSECVTLTRRDWVMSVVLVTLRSLPLHWAPPPWLAVYVRVTQAMGRPANSTTAAATGVALCSTARSTLCCQALASCQQSMCKDRNAVLWQSKGQSVQICKALFAAYVEAVNQPKGCRRVLPATETAKDG